MSTRGLSKSRIISGCQCAKRLYLETYRPELLEGSDQMERQFAMGNAVGEVARQLYPGGILIGAVSDPAAALEETVSVMQARPDAVLFEPAFSHDGVLIRADVLQPGRQGYRLVEVKAATRPKDYHYTDCAIQAWVMEEAGYPLERVELAVVDSAFVYKEPGNYRGLLARHDLTEAVRPMVGEVAGWVSALRDMMAGDCPEVAPGPQCHDPYECPFISHCAGPQAEYPVTTLYRGGQAAASLREEGMEDIRDVPPDRLRSDIQQRQQRVVCSGQAECDPALGEYLRALPYPRYYMDFETMQFAVPIWLWTRPYEQLPFQWSVHVESGPGEVRHREFLDTSGEAPMRAFCESLIEALGETGPILVYSHFEKRILNEMAIRFPELAPRLHAIVARLEDLLPLVRTHYYHPDMQGSFSIKAVLPTVAPELDYKELGEVQHGGAAQDAYLEMIDAATSAERKQQLAEDLRRYCERDTEAMVVMVHHFQNTN